MGEHTPAPWTAEISPGIALVIIRGPDGEVIVSDDNSLSDANAHLIAAAPDMLSALKVVREAHRSALCDLGCNDDVEGDSTLEMMDSVIAKAEGRS